MGKSNRVTLRDARRVFHLLEEIKELRADPAAAKAHLVASACRIVSARQGSMLTLTGWSPDGDVKVTGVTHGGWASPEAARLWEDLMLFNEPRRDLLLDCAVRIPGPLQTRVREQIVPDDVWRANPDYAALAQYAGIGHHLCAWSGPGDGSCVAITLHRGFGERPFALRDRNVLHLLNVELSRLTRDGGLHLFGNGDGAGGRTNGGNGNGNGGGGGNGNGGVANGGGSSPTTEKLSPRERDVLRALLEGDSVKQAGLRLGITFRTAEGYVKALYRHFRVHSRGELAALFLPRPPQDADEGGPGDGNGT